jgi:ABC-2 type transport system permease protein
MSSVLAIARVNLLRVLRDRMGLFFIFLLPFVLILVLGTVYGGRVAPRLGVVSPSGDPLAEALVATIRDGDLQLEMHARGSENDLRDAVASGALELGLVIPAGYSATIGSGEAATVLIVGQPTNVMSALREAVVAGVARQVAELRAARIAADTTNQAFDAALEQARASWVDVPGVEVAVTSVGTSVMPTNAGPFDLGAQSQLVLFMFLTSMTAATQLILTRQLGVSRRMLATPTSVGRIISGEALGRFAVAMMQGVFIVVLSALAFNVRWGDLLAASLVVCAFALVGTGVAMVVGTFANNADQAGSVGVFAGMALAAVGGAMVPLELFAEPMHTVAFLTPHAWAIAAFRDLVFHQGDALVVLPSLLVLLAMGAATLALGAWRLRRDLVGA